MATDDTRSLLLITNPWVAQFAQEEIEIDALATSTTVNTLFISGQEANARNEYS